MALLRCAAKCDAFLSLDCAKVEASHFAIWQPWAIWPRRPAFRSGRRRATNPNSGPAKGKVILATKGGRDGRIRAAGDTTAASFLTRSTDKSDGSKIRPQLRPWRPFTGISCPFIYEIFSCGLSIYNDMESLIHERSHCTPCDTVII